jgi:O-antigen/teichoic acid export membrane protein
MRIRHRSLIILLSQGINQASTLLLGILLVRLVSQEIFGTYRQVYLVYGFIGGLMTLRLSNSLYYFLPKYGKNGRRVILGQTILQTAIIAGMISITMWICSTPVSILFDNSQLKQLIRVFSPYPLAAEVLNLVPAYMISLERPLRGGIYAAAASILRMCIAVSIFALGGEIIQVILVTVVIVGLIAMIGCVDMIRLSPQGSWKFTKSSVVEQFSYTWPLWLTATVGIISLQFGKLVISASFTPDVYAIYSVGAIELPIVGLVTGSLATAIMPNLVIAVDKGTIQQALSIWKEAVRKGSFFVLPCFVFFLVFGQDFIILLYGKNYSMAAWPFLILLFILPLRVAVYGPLLRAIGDTRSISMAAIYAMVVNIAVGISIVWLGEGGIISFVGPSIGLVCGSLTMNIYQLKRIGQLVHVPIRILMPWKMMGLLLFLCALAAMGAVAIPLECLSEVVGARLMIKALIFILLLFGLVWWIPLLRKDERLLIMTLVSTLFGKISGYNRRKT